MENYKLILPDGTAVTSGADQKNALKSVTLTETVNAGTELTLGSACASLLEAAVITAQPLNLAAGEEVKLFRGETLLGVFVLEQPTCPSPNTARLTGYDRIIRLDRDLTLWLASLEGFPMDMETFAGRVCAACGLELACAGIPNGDMTVEKFTGDGVTGRQLMQWVGEASGTFVRATADGRITLESYTPSGITLRPAGEGYYFALGFADYTVDAVDGVQLRTEAGLWPAEGENGYVITGNPLLKATEETLPRLETVRAAIPWGYRPCTVSLPVQPGLRAGQSVTVVDGSGASFTALAMGITTAGNKMTLHCTGERRRGSTAAVNNKTASQTAAESRVYARSLAKQAVEGQTQQDIFLKLTDNGRLKGVFMEDGELYLNADFLSTGVIRSADGTVELDLGNNAVTVNGQQNGKKIRLVMSAAGFRGYGENAAGELEEVLDFRLGVDGAPTGIVNGAWQGNTGLLVAAAAGVLTLGTTEASTQLLGDFVTIDSPTENVSILGKRVYWRANGDGTCTLTAEL